MIEKPTVLVLGAGASKPYGFPTGNEILANIVTGASWRKLKVLFEGSLGPRAASLLKADYKRLSDKIQEVPHDSIDQLLSRWPDLSNIGKQIIATEILDAETTSLKNLFLNDKPHWYSTLFRRLTDEVNSVDKIDLLKKNLISIVTFNYDRSLDFFLYKSLLSFIDVQDDKQLIAYFRSIPIIHMYGRIADPFTPSSLEYFQYGATPNYDDILRLSKNINVMYSSRPSQGVIELESIFSEPRRANIKAKVKRVYFIGFGYHPSNLELLGIHPKPAAIDFYGTTKDIPRGKYQDLKSKLHIRMPTYSGGPTAEQYFNEFCFEAEECGEFVNHHLL